jgi:hypothetical protein
MAHEKTATCRYCHELFEPQPSKPGSVTSATGHSQTSSQRTFSSHPGTGQPANSRPGHTQPDLAFQATRDDERDLGGRVLEHERCVRASLASAAPWAEVLEDRRCRSISAGGIGDVAELVSGVAVMVQAIGVAKQT